MVHYLYCSTEYNQGVYYSKLLSINGFMEVKLKCFIKLLLFTLVTNERYGLKNTRKVSAFGVFWSVISHIRIEYGEIRSISPNAGKYGPEKLGISTLFTKRDTLHLKALYWKSRYFITYLIVTFYLKTKQARESHRKSAN